MFGNCCCKNEKIKEDKQAEHLNWAELSRTEQNCLMTVNIEMALQACRALVRQTLFHRYEPIVPFYFPVLQPMKWCSGSSPTFVSYPLSSGAAFRCELVHAIISVLEQIYCKECPNVHEQHCNMVKHSEQTNRIWEVCCFRPSQLLRTQSSFEKTCAGVNSRGPGFDLIPYLLSVRLENHVSFRKGTGTGSGLKATFVRICT